VIGAVVADGPPAEGAEATLELIHPSGVRLRVPAGFDERTVAGVLWALEDELRAMPKRVPVRELWGEHDVVRLEQERKMLTDTIKLVAYRAETQLANLVGPLLPDRADEARSFLQKVFQLPADLLPQPKEKRLVGRIYGMANPRSNSALASLCEALNRLEVNFPGTDLQLVLETTASRQ
jgi:hypothetical protein